MDSLLKPQFFVTRQNGSMVPLVALDEFPPTISIRGVPRQLSPYDISGMTGVGIFEARHKYYIVDGVRINNLADRSIMSSIYAPVTDTHQQTDSIASKTYGIEEQPPKTSKASAKVSNTSVSVGDKLMDQSNLPPWHDSKTLPVNTAPGVKQFCSFWLRNGECDYAQQGCLYKHEMPLDPEILRRLGLRDVPRWYREKHGLRSFLAAGDADNTATILGDEKPKVPMSVKGNENNKNKNINNKEYNGRYGRKLTDDKHEHGHRSVIRGKSIQGATKYIPPNKQAARTSASDRSGKNGKGKPKTGKPTYEAKTKKVQKLPSSESTSLEAIRKWQMKETLANLNPSDGIPHEVEVLAQQYNITLPMTSQPRMSSIISSSSSSSPLPSQIHTSSSDGRPEKSLPSISETSTAEIESSSEITETMTPIDEHHGNVTMSKVFEKTVDGGVVDDTKHAKYVILKRRSGPPTTSALRISFPKEPEPEEFYDCE